MVHKQAQSSHWGHIIQALCIFYFMFKYKQYISLNVKLKWDICKTTQLYGVVWAKVDIISPAEPNRAAHYMMWHTCNELYISWHYVHSVGEGAATYKHLLYITSVNTI